MFPHYLLAQVLGALARLGVVLGDIENLADIIPFARQRVVILFRERELDFSSLTAPELLRGDVYTKIEK